MRDQDEITGAEDELADRVWHERHLVLMAEHPDRTDMKEAKRTAQAIRHELGESKASVRTRSSIGAS